MRDIWLVIKHDMVATLRQRSFWLLTLLMPVLLVGLNGFLIVQESGRIGRNEDAETMQAETAAAAPSLTGLVDESGLLAGMPLDPSTFVFYPDSAAARAALDAGDIDLYVQIPADYVRSGQLAVYDDEFRVFGGGSGQGAIFGDGREWTLQYLIDYSLAGDEQLLRAIGNPIPLSQAKEIVLQPTEERGEEELVLARVVASVLPYIYYFLLIMGGNYLMRSVVVEKENRTVEVLLLSLPARKLMVGKMLAMSTVMLIQLVVWVGGGILILNRGAVLMNVASFAFPPGFWSWAALFLVLGYLLYASVMMAAGAIAQNAREASQVMWLLIIPLMPTLMFGQLFLEEPHGTLAVVLSLFPLSAPSAMVTRLAVSQVPLWQILTSLAGLATLTYVLLTLASRFFQAGNLLSQSSFNWRRLATGWRKVEAPTGPN